ncbi:DUF4189 domain-containing protein [Nocardia sp. NPDC056100]|uniref:DUF4189 domain-containing protein n=1 Tax=Nocardia sp. NPDC056100 TaxID=3345712 RepID=UPI0035E027B4
MRKIISRLIVGIAVIAGSSVAVLPTANATTYYGAIAVSSDGSIGKAWDYPWSSDARNAALSSCGRSDCSVLASFSDCGAVGYSPGAGMYNGGTGSTRSVAESNARRYTDSYIVASVCN